MIGRLVPPSHPLPLGNNHPSLSRDPITAQPRAQTWWLRASTALPAPPSGLQLPGVGRAPRAAIDCGGRRRRRSGGAGGLGGCTASVGVTAGCRLWCTTHRQKPPGHNPHAASTSPNLRKKITKKSLCGKLFCILTVKLSVTKGKEAWRGLIWWRALGRCLVKKNNRRAD